MSDAKLKITQVRSVIGRPEKHRRVIEALGLKRHQMSVVWYSSSPTRETRHRLLQSARMSNHYRPGLLERVRQLDG